MNRRLPAAAMATVLLIIGLSTILVRPANVARAAASIRIPRRTVSQSEIGLIFAYPNGFSWTDVGAFVGLIGSGYFAKMSPDAIKVEHGRAQHFMPADDKGYSHFPYAQFKQYEAKEMAEGRDPLFITATYQGKKRPVYHSWSLNPSNGTPTTPPEMWFQAVNMSSDRYIDFWVKQYVRGVLWHNQSVRPNYWVGIDNCGFRWDLYGVLDDSNHFVRGVPWDPPLPHNRDAYLAFVAQFFHKLAKVAPEVKTMCNVGSMEDPSKFQEVWADIPGMMMEDIRNTNPQQRVKQQSIMNEASWFGEQGRVAILRSIVQPDDPDDLRFAYLVYLLVKGPNFFFAPQFSTKGSLAVPPSQYSAMRADLGEPTEPLRTEPDKGKGPPYNLYSRTYESGIIYMNWTGAPKTIKLPSDRQYVDLNGDSVKSITVPDLKATYVKGRH